MGKDLVARKNAFEKLNRAFQDHVIPIVEAVEFEQSVLIGAGSGLKNNLGDIQYCYISLQTRRLLDTLRFLILPDDLSIRVYYNRFRLDRDVANTSELANVELLPLLLEPYSKTEKELVWKRFIPLFRTPKNYAVRGKIDEKNVQKSVMEPITYLHDDLLQFDIIRGEWNEEYEPMEIQVVPMEQPD